MPVADSCAVVAGDDGSANVTGPEPQTTVQLAAIVLPARQAVVRDRSRERQRSSRAGSRPGRRPALTTGAVFGGYTVTSTEVAARQARVGDLDPERVDPGTGNVAVVVGDVRIGEELRHQDRVERPGVVPVHAQARRRAAGRRPRPRPTSTSVAFGQRGRAVRAGARRPAAGSANSPVSWRLFSSSHSPIVPTLIAGVVGDHHEGPLRRASRSGCGGPRLRTRRARGRASSGSRPGRGTRGAGRRCRRRPGRRRSRVPDAGVADPGGEHEVAAALAAADEGGGQVGGRERRRSGRGGVGAPGVLARDGRTRTGSRRRAPAPSRPALRRTTRTPMAGLPVQG